jgi:flotillin
MNLIPQLSSFAEMALPIIVLLGVAFFALRTVARCYIKVAPNEVAIVYGRKFKGKDNTVRGFRYVVGGGFVLIPILEKLQMMSLNTMQVTAQVKDVPDKDGALVSVTAIANVKVQSDDQALPLAIERFLGNTPAQIAAIIQGTLEGNLRAIVGQMEIQELLRDRQKFMQTVLKEAGADLGKMGITVDVAQIQDIRDPRNYIDSLGMKKTAEVVRDATIGKAEAQRDADQSSAAARQIGETKKAEAELAISNAQRDRDMGIADNEAKVKAQQAMIPIAAEIAAANRTAELNKAKVEADKATVTAGIALQGEQQKLNEASLEATVVTSARKAKDAKIIEGEAEQAFATLTGEAERIKAEKLGQGTQAQQTGEAEGRKQLASAHQAELIANAEGEKAGLLARAAGKQADIVAEAEGKLRLADATKAQLLAEAEGILKRAEAYKQLDSSGRFLLILQALPPIIDSIGTAGEKIVKPLAEAIGEGLGNIDEVKIIDMGGNQTGGGNLLTRFGSTPIQLIYQLVEQAKAAGFGPFVEELAKKAGVDLNALGQGSVEGQNHHAPDAPPAHSAE